MRKAHRDQPPISFKAARSGSFRTSTRVSKIRFAGALAE
jgi:hypothetical protein